jgi:hypothetical protein
MVLPSVFVIPYAPFGAAIAGASIISVLAAFAGFKHSATKTKLKNIAGYH